MVRVDELRSFVVSDIPGLIEGASEGLGLGHRFLKHLSRTAVLWHVVDLSEPDDAVVVQQIKTIQKELEQYDPEFLEKPCWLVFNKIDAVAEDEVEKRIKAIVKKIKWKGRFFAIAAIKKQNTQALCFEMMNYLETCTQ